MCEYVYRLHALSRRRRTCRFGTAQSLAVSMPVYAVKWSMTKKNTKQKAKEQKKETKKKKQMKRKETKRVVCA